MKIFLLALAMTACALQAADCCKCSCKTCPGKGCTECDCSCSK